MSTNFRCGLGAVLFIASCQLAAVGQGPSERPRELPLSSSPSVVQPTENWNDLLRQYGTADDAGRRGDGTPVDRHLRPCIWLSVRIQRRRDRSGLRGAL
ncbi:MAG: hypothetical protein ACTHOU_09535, partial [Aureliella sp.]